MNEDRKPDKAEKRIRFGCGFVVGIILALGGIWWFVDAPTATLVTIGAFCVAVSMGICAMFFGDRFWAVLSRLLNLWP